MPGSLPLSPEFGPCFPLRPPGVPGELKFPGTNEEEGPPLGLPLGEPELCPEVGKPPTMGPPLLLVLEEFEEEPITGTLTEPIWLGVKLLLLGVGAVVEVLEVVFVARA